MGRRMEEVSERRGAESQRDTAAGRRVRRARCGASRRRGESSGSGLAWLHLRSEVCKLFIGARGAARRARRGEARAARRGARPGGEALATPVLASRSARDDEKTRPAEAVKQSTNGIIRRSFRRCYIVSHL